MSYTELFKFNKNGEAEDLGEVNNAWRGAMAIWTQMERKYLPSLPAPTWARTDEERNRYHSRTSQFSNDENGNHPMKPVWDLARDESVDECERVAMLSTFDNVVLKREDFKDVITAFNNVEFESSLPEQAKLLEEALADEDCVAVAWNQTSINADNWVCYDYDDETDENIPYNINTGDKHWFMFDSVTEEADA